ncbi:hypothetical protein [Leucobacter sp.]
MTELSAEVVEGWVASMRQEVVIEAPTPGGVRTPDQIIRDLEKVDEVAAQALRVVKEADKVRAAAAETLLKARAAAEQSAVGRTAAARKAHADLAVAEERAELELARIAYRYAQGLADLLDSRRSSLQTQSKLVLATVQMAGIPRRG